MNQRYIKEEGSRELLLVDDKNEVNAIHDTEDNIKIINLENIIEIIKNKISAIEERNIIIRSNIIESICSFIISTLMGVGAGKICVLTFLDYILTSNIIELICGMIMGLITGCIIYIDILSITDLIKSGNKKTFLKREFEKSCDLIKQYEKDLVELKQKVKVNTNINDNIHKKYYVYEFDSESIEEATNEYVDDTKRNGFKKRTLTK